MGILEIDNALIEGIYKISQAIWEKHGWLSSPNKTELKVYLEATMIYLHEHKNGKELK